MAKDKTFSLKRRTNSRLSPPSSRFEADRSLTREEQYIVDQWRKQELAMVALEAKTNYGKDKIAAINRHSVNTFIHTMADLWQLRQLAADTEYAHIVYEFTDQNIRLLGQHLLDATDIGASKIAEEIHRSLHPNGELPEPSFTEKLVKLLTG